MYDPTMVQPMRDELKNIGFKELTTVQEVDEGMGSATDLSSDRLCIFTLKILSLDDLQQGFYARRTLPFSLAFLSIFLLIGGQNLQLP